MLKAIPPSIIATYKPLQLSTHERSWNSISFRYPVSFPIYLDLSKICFDIQKHSLPCPWLPWCLFLFLIHLQNPRSCFSLIPLSSPIYPLLMIAFASPNLLLHLYSCLITLHPLVPICLLLNFKYGHFGNPFLFFSKVVSFSSLVTNVSCPTLCLTRRMEVMV